MKTSREHPLQLRNAPGNKHLAKDLKHILPLSAVRRRLTLWSQTSTPQNREKIHFCCLGHSKLFILRCSWPALQWATRPHFFFKTLPSLVPVAFLGSQPQDLLPGQGFGQTHHHPPPLCQESEFQMERPRNENSLCCWHYISKEVLLIITSSSLPGSYLCDFFFHTT